MWGKARYVMTFSLSGEYRTQYPSIYSKSNQSFQPKLWSKQHTEVAESAKCLFIELVAGGHKKGQTPSHQHYWMQQAEALSIKDPSTELLHGCVPPHRLWSAQKKVRDICKYLCEICELLSDENIMFSMSEGISIWYFS